MPAPARRQGSRRAIQETPYSPTAGRAGTGAQTRIATKAGTTSQERLAGSRAACKQKSSSLGAVAHAAGAGATQQRRHAGEARCRTTPFVRRASVAGRPLCHELERQGRDAPTLGLRDKQASDRAVS
jgi:hypothetical protein